MARVYVLVNMDIMPKRVWWRPSTWKTNYSHYAVQVAHAVAELMGVYYDDKDLRRWAQVDKTLVVLAADIKDMRAISNQSSRPYAFFNETGPAVFGYSDMAIGPLERDEARLLLGHLPLLRI